MELNNETIRLAIKDWISDAKSAEEEYGHISIWDTSSVTDMNRIFFDIKSFNEPIADWDVSNVTDMSYMFF